MVNVNGVISKDNHIISIENRGYAYGDALFETIKTLSGKLLFWEDHYFRLMASMRIMRMEIPTAFTMEFLEQQVYDTLEANNILKTQAKAKLMVHRKEGGLYLPDHNGVDFVVSVQQVDQAFYTYNARPYEVDLFTDNYVSPSLLSTLKTTNKALQVVGSLYAKTYGLDNCLVLNTDRHVIEALNGNIFVMRDKKIKTPPLTDGCLRGVMRKQVMALLKQLPEYVVLEAPVLPFELQQADEIFITNTILGIQPITKYRKKIFDTAVSKMLIERLNTQLRANTISGF